IMNKEQLHTLIARYFDGDTTVAEERELRRELATTVLWSPLIDEARAVTGYFAACRTKSRHRKPRVAIWQRTVAAAIVAVIVMSMALGIVSHNISADDSCIAYVDGTTVTDGAIAYALVSEQLAMMGEAAEIVENDVIDDLRNVFDLSADGID
ncbi:MAG: hypothetical protein K2M76_02150, partial [Muribaculaceae bacterium]|nr:hypothetical protein [Muribaculaceae bacterium]